VKSSIKFAVLACGVLGLVACFLPVVSMPGLSVTFWDTHETQAVQTYLVMVGYAAGAVMGGIGVVKGMTRSSAVAAAAGFGLVLVTFRSILGNLWSSAIGGKLLLVAAIGGVVVSLVAAALPEDRATS